jgi:hypothetical protein
MLSNTYYDGLLVAFIDYLLIALLFQSALTINIRKSRI